MTSSVAATVTAVRRSHYYNIILYFNEEILNSNDFSLLSHAIYKKKKKNTILRYF